MNDPGVLANIAMIQGRLKEASRLISRAENLPRGSHRDWATVKGLRALLLMHEGRYRGRGGLSSGVGRTGARRSAKLTRDGT
ncbi:MAG: hypothetical protein ACJ746_02170 [Bryobacteraceae bacterium]